MGRAFLVPKNYAFSYSVKDAHSGDDFSHSQAHNGKATRGQYRVKLPDGRVQVVSYTADHKGYRADVQYEDESVHKPVVVQKPLYHPSVQNTPQTPNALPSHKPNTLQTLDHYLRGRVLGYRSDEGPVRYPDQEEPSQSLQQQVYQSPRVVYVSTQQPPRNRNYNYVPVYVQPEFGARTTAAPPPQPTTSSGPERFSLNHPLVSTYAPHLVQSNEDKFVESNLQQKYASTPGARFVTTTPSNPYVSSPQYITSSEAPQYVTPTPAPIYVTSSTPASPYYATPTTARPHYVSTTPEPEYSQEEESPQVIVTPRAYKQPTRVIYRFVQDRGQ